MKYTKDCDWKQREIRLLNASLGHEDILSIRVIADLFHV